MCLIFWGKESNINQRIIILELRANLYNFQMPFGFYFHPCYVKLSVIPVVKIPAGYTPLSKAKNRPCGKGKVELIFCFSNTATLLIYAGGVIKEKGPSSSHGSHYSTQRMLVTVPLLMVRLF